MADESNETEVSGEGAYGTIHVMEQEMRAKAQGVYENKSAGAAPENKSLSAMNKAELVAAAEAAGVAVDDGDTKAELIAKIEKARK